MLCLGLVVGCGDDDASGFDLARWCPLGDEVDRQASTGMAESTLVDGWVDAAPPEIADSTEQARRCLSMRPEQAAADPEFASSRTELTTAFRCSSALP